MLREGVLHSLNRPATVQPTHHKRTCCTPRPVVQQISLSVSLSPHPLSLSRCIYRMYTCMYVMYINARTRTRVYVCMRAHSCMHSVRVSLSYLIRLELAGKSNNRGKELIRKQPIMAITVRIYAAKSVLDYCSIPVVSLHIYLFMMFASQL